MKIDLAHPDLPLESPDTTPKREKNPPIQRHTHKKRLPLRIGKVFFYAVIAIIGTGLTFSYQVLLSAEHSIVQKEDKTPMLQQFKYLVAAEDKPLTGERKDRINILLLGMGGESHSSGIYLTDTIILMSLKPSTNQVAMLSIPRDMVVEIPGTMQFRKINVLNSLGRDKKYPGGGEAYALEAIEEMLEIDIPYFIRVDFTAFREMIDLVDGIKIDVERTFTDYSFPDYNYGYQVVSFQQGIQEMDGEKALQYSRSRHGTGGEGSDFARSRRQQQVLMALKSKLLSVSTITNPSRLSQIINSLGNHVATNIELWEMVRFAQISAQYSSSNISHHVLDSGPVSPLHSEISDETGAYVLIPDAGLGKYEDVQMIVRNMFIKNVVEEEGAKIEIQNGTKHNGWAATTSEVLKQEKLNILRIGNAKTRDYKKSVIYDLSADRKPETVKYLKAKFQANVSTIIPSILEAHPDGEVTFEDLEQDRNKQTLDTQIKVQNPKTDIILILGEESWAAQQGLSTLNNSLPTAP